MMQFFFCDCTVMVVPPALVIGDLALQYILPDDKPCNHCGATITRVDTTEAHILPLPGDINALAFQVVQTEEAVAPPNPNEGGGFQFDRDGGTDFAGTAPPDPDTTD